MARSKCKPTGFPVIDDYAFAVLDRKIPTCRRLRKGIRFALQRLDDSDVFIDINKTNKAIELCEKYFGVKILPWQRFIFGMIHCYYKSTDMVVWREFLIVMGRGNGKTKFIAMVVWYLTTRYHGVSGYNVDVIANSEDQAKLSFDDVYNMLEDTWSTSCHFFTRSKVEIKNKDTGSYIKYNTANAKTKDGKRTGCLVIDEEHEFETADQIKVFSSGFGKVKHGRIFKITTKGNVREGVLDDDLRLVDDMLDGKTAELDILPLVWEIDDEPEALNPEMWHKANPSLATFPVLQKALQAEFATMAYKSEIEEEFYTKRMNWPKMDREKVVASRPELMATARDIPDLTGLTAVGGIDYAILSDFASAGLLFRIGDERIWIQHTWVCKQSSDWSRIRIKPQLEKWEADGQLTIVDDVQIPPQGIVSWFDEQAKKYNIAKIALDHARYALLRELFEAAGWQTGKDGDLVLIRPLALASVSPVIESWFRTRKLIWGDVALMRWAANNTKRVRMRAESASGNYKYEKIEPRSRKNDPFMAFVHAATLDELLDDVTASDWLLDLKLAGW